MNLLRLSKVILMLGIISIIIGLNIMKPPGKIPSDLYQQFKFYQRNQEMNKNENSFLEEMVENLTCLDHGKKVCFIEINNNKFKTLCSQGCKTPKDFISLYELGQISLSVKQTQDQQIERIGKLVYEMKKEIQQTYESHLQLLEKYVKEKCDCISEIKARFQLNLIEFDHYEYKHAFNNQDLINFIEKIRRLIVKKSDNEWGLSEDLESNFSKAKVELQDLNKQIKQFSDSSLFRYNYTQQILECSRQTSNPIINYKNSLKILAHSQAVSSLLLLGNKILLSGSYDGTIKKLNCQEAELIQSESCHQQVNAIALSPDEKIIAAGGDDQAITIWIAPALQKQKTLKGAKSRVVTLAFLKDPNLLLSGGQEPVIYMWDIAKGVNIHKIQIDDKSFVLALNLSVKNSLLACSTLSDQKHKRQMVLIFDSRNWAKSYVFPTDQGIVRSVKFSQSESHFAVCKDQIVQIFAVDENWKLIQEINHRTLVYGTQFFQSDNLLITFGQGKDIFIWNWTYATIVTKLCGHTGPINSIVMTRDEATMFSGGEDQVIIVWEQVKQKDGQRNAIYQHNDEIQ